MATLAHTFWRQPCQHKSKWQVTEWGGSECQKGRNRRWRNVLQGKQMDYIWWYFGALNKFVLKNLLRWLISIIVKFANLRILVKWFTIWRSRLRLVNSPIIHMLHTDGTMLRFSLPPCTATNEFSEFNSKLSFKWFGSQDPYYCTYTLQTCFHSIGSQNLYFT